MSILQNYDLQRQTRAFMKMQKLLQFFEKSQCNPPRLQEALKIQIDLNIIPFREEDLEARVKEFASLEDCIKRNFSDILLTTMKILVALHDDRSMANEQRRIKHMGRCLTTFSGLISYQIPNNDNQELINLHVKIS